MKNLVPLLIAGIGTAREAQVEQAPSHSQAQGSFESLLARELGKGEEPKEVSPLEGEVLEEEEGESNPLEFLSATGLLTLVQPDGKSTQEAAGGGEGVQPVLASRVSDLAPTPFASAEVEAEVEVVDEATELLDKLTSEILSPPRKQEPAVEPLALELEDSTAGQLVRTEGQTPEAVEVIQTLEGSQAKGEADLTVAPSEEPLDIPERVNLQPRMREAGNFEPDRSPRLQVREVVQPREVAPEMPLDELSEQGGELDTLAQEVPSLEQPILEVDVPLQESFQSELKINTKPEGKLEAFEEVPKTETVSPQEEVVEPNNNPIASFRVDDGKNAERRESEDSPKLTPPESRKAAARVEDLGSEPTPQVPTEPQQLAETPEPEAPLRPTLDVRERETLLPKLVQKLESLVTEERTEVRIQLKPEHLGELKIKLSVERGIMVAEFVVQNETVRGIIASQLPQLYTALEGQGTPLSQVMIDIGLGERQAQEQQQSQTQAKQARAERTGRLGKLNAAGPPSYLGRSVWYQVDLRA